MYLRNYSTLINEIIYLNCHIIILSLTPATKRRTAHFIVPPQQLSITIPSTRHFHHKNAKQA